MENKPWYKKFKVLVGIATLILEALTLIFGDKITPAYKQLAIAILATGISIIGGHTATDVANQLADNKKTIGKEKENV